MDVSCYYSDATHRPGEGAAAICGDAEQDAADHALCFAQTSCGACVGATPSDGECMWFEGVGKGYCGHGCNWDHCGERSCGLFGGGTRGDGAHGPTACR